VKENMYVSSSQERAKAWNLGDIRNKRISRDKRRKKEM